MPSGEDGNLIAQNEIWRQRSETRMEQIRKDTAAAVLEKRLVDTANAMNEQTLDDICRTPYVSDAGFVGVNLDVVNHPPHYTAHPSGVECIEITRHMNFNLGNAMKYIWRADMKHDDDGIQDLEKAAWYIQDEVQRRRDS